MELHNYKPYSDCTQIYTVYKLDEENTSDEILDDRILISTIHPMNFIEVMNNERRSLNQITRLQGEVGFLVLSIDEFNESVAEQKRVLEKELNDLLYELGIARVTGSGIAPKRVYFEMFIFDKEELAVEKIKKLIVEIRNIRTQMNVVPSKKAKVIVVTDKKEIFAGCEVFFEKLAGASETLIQSDKANIDDNAVNAIVEGAEIYIPLDELVDKSKELERLSQEKTKLEAEIKRVESKLSNESFVAKAPQKVVDEEREKGEKYKAMLAKVLESL